MAYHKEEGYTYAEVKRLIAGSEGRGSLFTGGVAHGHASAMHQAIDDVALKDRLKMVGMASAFKDKADTNFGMTVKTEDQAFLLTEILNSKLGRAALQALDGVAAGTLARLSICYLVGNSSSFALREAQLVVPAGVSMNAAKMNAQLYGQVNSNTPMKQIMSVLDNGYPELQVVTNFPASEASIAVFGNHGGYSIQLQGNDDPVVTHWHA